jgi:hypothetical protein
MLTLTAHHLAPELVARLLSGRVEPDELARQVLPHLLAHCPGCQQVRDQLEELRRDVAHWDHLVALTEGPEAPGLWQRLAPLPHAERLAAVESDPAFHTWGLCSLLLKLAGDATRERPDDAARLARLAVVVAGRLGDAYHPAWVQDLRALGFVRLGDARRILGELASAANAFDTAKSLRLAGTGDPALEAEALTLEALLRRDQGRLADASLLLAHAHAIYSGADPLHGDPEAADPHQAALALAHRAWCLHHLGQPGPADALLVEAERLLDPERAPALLLAVRLGRVATAIAQAEWLLAETRLPVADQLAARLGNLPARHRLRRAAAAIAVARHQPGPAEQSLRDAVQGCLEADLGGDAALALLDLAALYLDRGALEALHHLAVDVLPVFAAPDLERDAFQALLRFQGACAGGLTPVLVGQLAAQIERSRPPSILSWSLSATVLGEERDTDDAAPSHA